MSTFLTHLLTWPSLRRPACRAFGRLLHHFPSQLLELHLLAAFDGTASRALGPPPSEASAEDRPSDRPRADSSGRSRADSSGPAADAAPEARGSLQAPRHRRVRGLSQMEAAASATNPMPLSELPGAHPRGVEEDEEAAAWLTYAHFHALVSNVAAAADRRCWHEQGEARLLLLALVRMGSERAGMRELAISLARALAFSRHARLMPIEPHTLPWATSADPLVYRAVPLRYSSALASEHLHLLPSLMRELTDRFGLLSQIEREATLQLLLPWMKALGGAFEAPLKGLESGPGGTPGSGGNGEGLPGTELHQALLSPVVHSLLSFSRLVASGGSTSESTHMARLIEEAWAALSMAGSAPFLVPTLVTELLRCHVAASETSPPDAPERALCSSALLLASRATDCAPPLLSFTLSHLRHYREPSPEVSGAAAWLAWRAARPAAREPLTQTELSVVAMLAPLPFEQHTLLASHLPLLLHVLSTCYDPDAVSVLAKAADARAAMEDATSLLAPLLVHLAPRGHGHGHASPELLSFSRDRLPALLRGVAALRPGLASVRALVELLTPLVGPDLEPSWRELALHWAVHARDPDLALTSLRVFAQLSGGGCGGGGGGGGDSGGGGSVSGIADAEGEARPHAGCDGALLRTLTLILWGALRDHATAQAQLLLRLLRTLPAALLASTAASSPAAEPTVHAVALSPPPAPPPPPMPPPPPPDDEEEEDDEPGSEPAQGTTRIVGLRLRSWLELASTAASLLSAQCEPVFFEAALLLSSVLSAAEAGEGTRLAAPQRRHHRTPAAAGDRLLRSPPLAAVLAHLEEVWRHQLLPPPQQPPPPTPPAEARARDAAPVDVSDPGGGHPGGGHPGGGPGPLPALSPRRERGSRERGSMRAPAVPLDVLIVPRLLGGVAVGGDESVEGSGRRRRATLCLIETLAVAYEEQIASNNHLSITALLCHALDVMRHGAHDPPAAAAAARAACCFLQRSGSALAEGLLRLFQTRAAELEPRPSGERSLLASQPRAFAMDEREERLQLRAERLREKERRRQSTDVAGTGGGQQHRRIPSRGKGHRREPSGGRSGAARVGGGGDGREAHLGHAANPAEEAQSFAEGFFEGFALAFSSTENVAFTAGLLTSWLEAASPPPRPQPAACDGEQATRDEGESSTRGAAGHSHHQEAQGRARAPAEGARRADRPLVASLLRLLLAFVRQFAPRECTPAQFARLALAVMRHFGRSGDGELDREIARPVELLLAEMVARAPAGTPPGVFALPLAAATTPPPPLGITTEPEAAAGAHDIDGGAAIAVAALLAPDDPRCWPSLRECADRLQVCALSVPLEETQTTARDPATHHELHAADGGHASRDLGRTRQEPTSPDDSAASSSPPLASLCELPAIEPQAPSVEAKLVAVAPQPARTLSTVTAGANVSAVEGVATSAAGGGAAQPALVGGADHGASAHQAVTHASIDDEAQQQGQPSPPPPLLAPLDEGADDMLGMIENPLQPIRLSSGYLDADDEDLDDDDEDEDLMVSIDDVSDLSEDEDPEPNN